MWCCSGYTLLRAGEEHENEGEREEDKGFGEVEVWVLEAERMIRG